jgi:hypothetical protein
MYPKCIIDLGNNIYQCTKYKFYINTKILPIRCSLCNDSGTEPTLPPLTTQATNFAKSAFQHAIGGFKKTEPEEYSRRLDICGQCGKFSNGRCSICGCFLTVKASWNEQHCPDGKW